MGAIRPLYALLQFKKRYGEKRFAQLCRIAADARQDPVIRGAAWPDWNYAPSNAVAIVESNALQTRAARGIIPDSTKTAWQRVMTFVTWRMTQGVYVFDCDAFDALWASEPAREIPAATLQHLPEWCPYVEVPEGSQAWAEGWRGFFAWLDIAYLRLEDQDSASRPALVMLADRADEKSFLLSIDLVHPTLDACLARSYRLSGEAMEEACHRVWPILSVLLYLCSVNAEIVSVQGQPRSATPARPARPAAEPKRWQVGWRIGAALRQARGEIGSGERQGSTSRAAPRPHVRRAHFHGYWLGPREAPDKRRFEVRWLPPTFVNVDADHPVVPTERPVPHPEDS